MTSTQGNETIRPNLMFHTFLSKIVVVFYKMFVSIYSCNRDMWKSKLWTKIARFSAFFNNNWIV
jgi:hypothetical protein